MFILYIATEVAHQTYGKFKNEITEFNFFAYNLIEVGRSLQTAKSLFFNLFPDLTLQLKLASSFHILSNLHSEI
jgi:hypothetical protein